MGEEEDEADEEVGFLKLIEMCQCRRKYKYALFLWEGRQAETEEKEGKETALVCKV